MDNSKLIITQFQMPEPESSVNIIVTVAGEVKKCIKAGEDFKPSPFLPLVIDEAINYFEKSLHVSRQEIAKLLYYELIQQFGYEIAKEIYEDYLDAMEFEERLDDSVRENWADGFMKFHESLTGMKPLVYNPNDPESLAEVINQLETILLFNKIDPEGRMRLHSDHN